MKKIISLALFGILALSGLTLSANAAYFEKKLNQPQYGELKKFGKFLDKHRNIENDLRSDPQLINDAQYLSHHKDLEKFLRKNPRVTADLSNNPNFFMNRENRYQRTKHHRRH